MSSAYQRYQSRRKAKGHTDGCAAIVGVVLSFLVLAIALLVVLDQPPGGDRPFEGSLAGEVAGSSYRILGAGYYAVANLIIVSVLGVPALLFNLTAAFVGLANRQRRWLLALGLLGLACNTATIIFFATFR